jgi:hypothetical protein
VRSTCRNLHGRRRNEGSGWVPNETGWPASLGTSTRRKVGGRSFRLGSVRTLGRMTFVLEPHLAILVHPSAFLCSEGSVCWARISTHPKRFRLSPDRRIATTKVASTTHGGSTQQRFSTRFLDRHVFWILTPLLDTSASRVRDARRQRPRSTVPSFVVSCETSR